MLIDCEKGISYNLTKATVVDRLGFRKIDVVYPPNLRRFAKVVKNMESVPVPNRSVSWD